MTDQEAVVWTVLTDAVRILRARAPGAHVTIGSLDNLATAIFNGEIHINIDSDAELAFEMIEK